MDLSRRRLLTGGLAALATWPLASCTSPAGPTPSPTQPPPAPSGVNSKPADQLVQAGSVRLPISAIPTQWNPWHQQGDSPDAERLRGPLSAPAFAYDTSGSPQPNPDMIASASATGTPTVVTLTLNPQAVWGDGTPIVAADWIATWRAVGTGEKRFAARAVPGWERVAEVRQGSTDHEVIVTYRAADPDWAQPLAPGPARAASVTDPGVFNGGWTTYQAGWFAGPYVLTHLDARQGVVTLEPNPRWWGTTPRLGEVYFRTVLPDAVAAGFAAGEFDVYDSFVGDPRLPIARGASDHALRIADSGTGRALTFDPTGVLADPKLRQALVRGIDRVKLSRALAGPLGRAPRVWSNHLLLPQQPGYADAAEATSLTFDAAAAGQALTADGWALTSGTRRRGSLPLSLSFTVPTGDEVAAAEADSIAGDLKALGIDVRTVTSGGDLTVTSVAVPRYPLRDVASRVPAFPGLARYADQLATTVDATARAGLAAIVANQTWTTAATLPLYVQPQIVLTRGKLANLGASGLGTVDWSKVGWTS